jgi:RecG-like helicase
LCTTVIEDTPPVENTTMINVEKSELSDAVRLHRLRGHLVKSQYSSHCHYIVSDDATEEQLNLVDLVCHETDGLALAEKVSDPSNELSLRWANKDVLDLRLQARNLAHQLSLRDLKRCRWPLLNNAVRHWWSDFSIPDQRSKNQRQRYKKKRRR